MPMLKRALLAIAALSITGCATSPHAPPAPDPAFVELSRAASRIADSWALVGAIDRAAAEAEVDRLPVDAADYGPKLSKRVTLRWAGDARPVLELLARDSGVKFKATGKPPAAPLPPVYIEVHEARVGDVVRDIGYQLGDRMQLVVTAIPDQESIEIVYAPNHR